jgi:Prp8 binding protein
MSGELVRHHGADEVARRPYNQSSLSRSIDSPLIELDGHSSEVFVARFDMSGRFVASGSSDRKIFVWDSFTDYHNDSVFVGHNGAIIDIQWSRDSSMLYSASSDMHIGCWDLEHQTRVRRYIGHEAIVNTIDISKRGEEILVSGSDDSSIGIWDPRVKNAASHIQSQYPITALALSPTGHEIYSGGIDNNIHVWDLRSKAIVYTMLGHNESITSLKLSPDTQSLLSYSLDCTARTWDVRPYAPTERLIRVYDGCTPSPENNLICASWSHTGNKIAAGSGDGTAVVWSTNDGKLSFKLPGHKGCVNSVEFSPIDESICKPTGDMTSMAMMSLPFWLTGSHSTFMFLRP